MTSAPETNGSHPALPPDGQPRVLRSFAAALAAKQEERSEWIALEFNKGQVFRFLPNWPPRWFHESTSRETVRDTAWQMRFLSEMGDPEQASDLAAALYSSDPATVIDGLVLRDIVNALIDFYLGVPTKPPSDSTDGRPATGSASTGGASPSA